MAVISFLDFIGALFSLLGMSILLSPLRKVLSREELWIILGLCALTTVINTFSFVSWLGHKASTQIAENLGDYLQILQPACWGMFFYVVVESALRREIVDSRQKMRALIEHMPVILHAYNKQGKLVACNRLAEEVSNIQPSDLERTELVSEIFAESGDVEQIKHESQNGGGDYQHRIRGLNHAEGKREIAWYNISRRFPINGWANWCIGLDMTQQLAAQRTLERMATHDELTRLPNRTLLLDRLQHALKDCQRNRTMGALLMLDLDHFKMVNDSFGHPVGDQLLCEISERLHTCLKSTDTLARFSGDEFVVLIERISNAKDAAAVAERLLRALSQAPFDIYGHQIRVRGSVGITIFPDDDVRIDELMKNMDLALYAAKESGRNSYHLYSRSMHQKLRRQHELSERLREAMEQCQLQLHYQPQVLLSNEKLVGVEALLRWPGFENGRISPSIFVPIAESTGLMPQLGDWVLRQACEQAARWQQDAHKFTVSINLSALQLFQPNLEDFLRELLDAHNLSAEQIDLEITESAVMRNANVAIDTMKKLKNHGFNISLDDFGTGYSSLSYLKRFPVNTIKIDQSFIREMENSTVDAAIVKSVIQLGHSLNMRVVAEGVETVTQKQHLINEGCDIMQGFLYARPMHAEELNRYLLTPDNLH